MLYDIKVQIERDREERRWMNRLMLIVPRGLNLMD